MAKQTKFLDKAYELGDASQTRALYESWAESYDAELQENRYASPARTAAAMAEAVADKAAPLLDLGCGTGLSGVALHKAGFAVIDGTDFSQEMLKAAAAKGVYRTLLKGDLNAPIPARPGDYANITAVGVFSPGHAPAALIDEVVALLPQGGCFGFSLNDHALEDPSYEARIKVLVEAGRIEVVSDAYGDHLPGIGLKAKIYVLRRL
ncbi:methyltransferase domain-containing protein [Pelagibius sp. CAU 1746]|uniref:class I SAM-dependent DNA methyltransferase n=1 Tax=Pelagibius sp. CAU 1746 TaxID=3140370 RepID=UPI00325A5738